MKASYRFRLIHSLMAMLLLILGGGSRSSGGRRGEGGGGGGYYYCQAWAPPTVVVGPAAATKTRATENNKQLFQYRSRESWPRNINRYNMNIRNGGGHHDRSSVFMVMLATNKRRGDDNHNDEPPTTRPKKRPRKKSFSSSSGNNRPPTQKGGKGPKPSPEDDRVLRLVRAIRIEDAIALIGKFYKEDKAVKLQLNTFNAVIKACSESRRSDAGLMANDVINLLEKYQMERRVEKQSTIQPYNAALIAWARSGRSDSGKEAEHILMEKIPKATIQKPSYITYNAVITAWGRSRDTAKAESIFSAMIDDYETGNKFSKPNVHSYSSLMDAWARSGSEQAGEKCESLLDLMEAKYEEGELDQKPNSISYTTAINAWSKQGNALKAEAVYKRMIDQGVKNNVPTFNSLMDAWARSQSKEAGEKCESLLDQMESKYEAGDLDQKPDTISYNTAINAWSKQGNAVKAEAVYKRMIDQGVKPNIRAFNALMDAWARSKSKEKGEKCELLLDQMDANYQKTGDLEQKPDAITYATAINAWAKQGNAVKAEAVYERMIDQGVKPNVRTISSLMDAWARSKSEDAGEKCESLLDQMESKYEAGELDQKPNTISYNTAINAWSKQGNAVKAEAVYERMIDQGVKPDVFSFSSLVDACAKSGSPDAGLEGDKILHGMSIEWNVEPNEIFLTSLLECWKKSTDSPKRTKRVTEIQMAISKLRKA